MARKRFDIYTRVFSVGLRWCLVVGRGDGVGDLVFGSEKEAEEYRDLLIHKEARDRESHAKWEAKRKAEAAAKAAAEDLDGFMDDAPPHLRAKAVKTLTRKLAYSAGYMSRRDHIRKRIAEGGWVEKVHVSRTGKDEYRLYFDSRNEVYVVITKTEAHYASHLLGLKANA